MKTIVVAGTFDNQGGKPSGLISKLFESYPGEPTIRNGGYYEELLLILEDVVEYDVVFWLANVDNSLPKIRNVKELNPRCMLVTSKRNDDDKYCFQELISRSLDQKANLTFEISKADHQFAIRVFDPLGVEWCPKTTDYELVMKNTLKRLYFLMCMTRQSCTMINTPFEFEMDHGFLVPIHKNAEIFHELIQPAAVVNRFLGNASFRCTHGFPSFRTKDCIAVSRRNVNKTGISAQDFVPVRLVAGKLFAYGQNKPSVDTPIQARLYERFPAINYMIHSHVYVEGAPFTETPIPCGAIEEVGEIMAAVRKYRIDTTNNFSINLIGHGSIVFARTLPYFSQVSYIKRDTPEVLVDKV